MFGICAVGTLAALRGRGLGTAMTWAAIEIGVGWGYRVAVLQASELGFRVYERMGFRIVDRYVLYTPAAGEGGSAAPA